MDRLNITGGGPSLRDDLADIVDILATKTHRLEISNNGFNTDCLVAIAKKHPEVTVRVSIEGLPKRNDETRGIKNGFDPALRTILHLRELGVRDIGFAMVISDQNAAELLDVYRLVSGLDVEFCTSTLHNSFYFHKEDNAIKDVDLAVGETRKYVQALLTSRRHDLRLRVKVAGAGDRVYLPRLKDRIKQFGLEDVVESVGGAHRRSVKVQVASRIGFIKGLLGSYEARPCSKVVGNCTAKGSLFRADRMLRQSGPISGPIPGPLSRNG